MKNPDTMRQAQLDKLFLKSFMPKMELDTIWQNCKGEEGQHFIDTLRTFSERIHSMPVIYETDGQGLDAIAYLHYFNGGMDWYITEKDKIKNEPQWQAFGLAAIGYEPTLGYISIQELIQNNVELDLYFKPRPLNELPAR